MDPVPGCSSLRALPYTVCVVCGKIPFRRVVVVVVVVIIMIIMIVIIIIFIINGIKQNSL